MVIDGGYTSRSVQNGPAAGISICRPGEGGAVALIVAIGLMLLLLLTGLASTNFGIVARGSRELQLAVDNAASSGAAQLCSSKECFSAARRAAIELVSDHTSISSIAADASMAIEESSIPENEYVWDMPDRNLRVQIERGIWNGTTFQSLEGDWQAEHPGVPNFMAANSVRVQAFRPKTQLLGNGYHSGEFSISASGIAVKGNTNPVQVAPFAIPVCSLINNKGEYYGDQSANEMCAGDRWFTRADRYGTAVKPEGLGNFRGPAFPWAPCNRDVASTHYTYQAPGKGGTIRDFDLYRPMDWGMTYFPYISWLNTFTSEVYGNPSNPNTYDGGSCALIHGTYTAPEDELGQGKNYWDQPNDAPTNSSANAWSGFGFGGRPGFPQPDNRGGSPQVSDHFGVVGLPGNQLADEMESQINSVLHDSKTPTWSAKLGDRFSVLGSGLTIASAETAIWDAIINGNNGTPGLPDGNHPAISSTPLGSFEREKVIFSECVEPKDTPSGVSYDCGNEIAAPSEGFDHVTNPKIFLPGTGLPDDPTLYSDGVQWVFKGANKLDGLCNSKWMEIGDLAPQGYASRLVGLVIPNPQLSDSTPVWKVPVPVIGDMGKDAASCVGMPGANSQDPVINPDREYLIIGYVEAYVYDVDIGNPKPVKHFNYHGFQHDLVGWGFMEDNSDVPSCNVVRARLDCKKWFLPDSGLTPQGLPTLVE